MRLTDHLGLYDWLKDNRESLHKVTFAQIAVRAAKELDDPRITRSVVQAMRNAMEELKPGSGWRMARNPGNPAPKNTPKGVPPVEFTQALLDLLVFADKEEIMAVSAHLAGDGDAVRDPISPEMQDLLNFYKPPPGG